MEINYRYLESYRFENLSCFQSGGSHELCVATVEESYPIKGIACISSRVYVNSIKFMKIE